MSLSRISTGQWNFLWANMNLKSFYEAKRKVLHLGGAIPSNTNWGTDSRPVEKGLLEQVQRRPQR